jgi:hypothetical protein
VPAQELRIGNRTAYFRKAIRTPDFESERVLARDAFEFAELWLTRNCKEALPYWSQARAYYQASLNLPAQSSPLTIYYCFLNATKALLLVKNVEFSQRHGVSGEFEASKRSLANEKIVFHGGGVLASLSRYLDEEERDTEHSLTDVLSNLPYIHRAFRYTFRSHPEMFIPVRKVAYRKHPTSDYIWVSASVEGRFADQRSMRTLPPAFELDQGCLPEFVIRTRKRIRWVERGESKANRESALTRLQNYHRRMRRHLVYIAASPDLWYLKRAVANTRRIERYGLTLAFAAMHRLSELSRYDPRGLMRYLEGKENWPLTEFIELAPTQLLDELVCEMTSLEFGLPGIRPRAA